MDTPDITKDNTIAKQCFDFSGKHELAIREALEMYNFGEIVCRFDVVSDLEMKFKFKDNSWIGFKLNPMTGYEEVSYGIISHVH